MAWENRGSSRYYYSAKKVNGRVVKRYWGKQWGDVGELCAHVDRLDNLRAQEARRLNDAPLLETCARVETCVCAADAFLSACAAQTLTAAGYHRPDRHAWRKKRMRRNPAQTKFDTDPTEPTTAPEQTSLITRDGKSLERTHGARLVLAACGKDEATPEITQAARAYLKTLPPGAWFSLDTGDSVRAVVDVVAQNKLHRELIEGDLAEKRRELTGGVNPSPLEKLLIERVLACWVAVAFFERFYMRTVVVSDISLATGEYLQKRAERANRQYMLAIKTLAQVRRLAVPLSVQVNVAAQGGQQVNVGGDLHHVSPTA